MNSRFNMFLIVVCFGLISAASAEAGSYNLFNSKPKGELRDLAADRPDNTETPITVDPGHIQFETSVIAFSRDEVGNAVGKSTTWMETNLKFGLVESADLQIVFAPYISEETEIGDAVVGDQSGFGDVEVRLKWNMLGNDGGKNAFALFPFVKIPTGSDLSNEEWEGGLILPFARDLREGLGLGLQAEFDFVYDDAKDEHRLDFLHTAVIGLDLTEQVGIFGEYLGIASSDYQAYASAGATYAVNENLQLDFGTLVGLNDAAEDFSIYPGFTLRF
ncbi:MAG: transporter [Gemmatimonadetes bacterium]|jgi:hypothetical protein|nr:transporter [Gemmatimonadota bacterium]